MDNCYPSLSSLVINLTSTLTCFLRFYFEHAERSQHPGDDEIARCLTSILKLTGHAPVYVIVESSGWRPLENELIQTWDIVIFGKRSRIESVLDSFMT